jgi:uncharacterized protein YlxW (UPF0749 family)
MTNPVCVRVISILQRTNSNGKICLLQLRTIAVRLKKRVSELTMQQTQLDTEKKKLSTDKAELQAKVAQLSAHAKNLQVSVKARKMPGQCGTFNFLECFVFLYAAVYGGVFTCICVVTASV